MAIQPIRLLYSTSVPQELLDAPEAATQIFSLGAPLRLIGGFAAIADSNWAAADVVYGIAAEPAHNLTTAGTPKPAFSEASPPNQPLAVIIPIGAWNRNGTVMMYKANSQNVFLASLAPGVSFAQSMVQSGQYCKLTYDAVSTLWYVDSGTTSGNGAVCEILGGVSDDPNLVRFRFKAGQRFFD